MIDRMICRWVSWIEIDGYTAVQLKSSSCTYIVVVSRRIEGFVPAGGIAGRQPHFGGLKIFGGGVVRSRLFHEHHECHPDEDDMTNHVSLDEYQHMSTPVGA